MTIISAFHRNRFTSNTAKLLGWFEGNYKQLLAACILCGQSWLVVLLALIMEISPW
jgi:hypothetical protein